jgi:hypothetical protein
MSSALFKTVLLVEFGEAKAASLELFSVSPLEITEKKDSYGSTIHSNIALGLILHLWRDMRPLIVSFWKEE